MTVGALMHSFGEHEIRKCVEITCKGCLQISEDRTGLGRKGCDFGVKESKTVEQPDL